MREEVAQAVRFLKTRTAVKLMCREALETAKNPPLKTAEGFRQPDGSVVLPPVAGKFTPEAVPLLAAS